MNDDEIVGVVEHGKQRGGILGFPTANIQISHSIAPGVYRGFVRLEGSQNLYMGALYLAPKSHILEVHILDFSGDLYGSTVSIMLQEKIRDPQVFDSESDLVTAITQDVQRIRRLSSSPA